MLEDDYLMRMIKNMARALGKILLNKEIILYELPVEEEYTSSDILYKRLLDMMEQGNINEAENLLYEEVDTKDYHQLELALSFYTHLNEYDDDFLEEHNYSREEIQQGIQDIGKEYGINLDI